ncbi:YtrH family sporulation protein [Paenibacillus turpanensis]|uniref:YtrH family sporulation protein n=1 Tax=Paenibacillus turpanensis TaxID=2689078 RepID=UPI001407BBD5|nr:YtrH family sporulation protein [Paenibacillus turpanensis]
MVYFLTKAIMDFCVAFGVVIGASLLVGVGAVLTLQPPKLMMTNISESLKIWAVVAAIGGTIDPIRAIESNILDGHMSIVLKQLLNIGVAFMGAHMGYELIRWICRTGG